MNRFFLQFIFSLFIALFASSAFAQTNKKKDNEELKPYKLLTEGRRFTIKSTKPIKNVLVWAANGHRMLEQRNINSVSFSFTPTINEKIFFLMIQYEKGQPFTEKIGIH